MKNAEMKGRAVRHTANHVSFDLYLMIRRIRNASQISDRTGIPRDQNEMNKNESHHSKQQSVGSGNMKNRNQIHQNDLKLQWE